VRSSCVGSCGVGEELRNARGASSWLTPTVNHQTIGYLERGEYNPSLELALGIGEHFGLPVDAIFRRKPVRADVPAAVSPPTQRR
jgi:DNA-binding XRE family transcriptional regulator